MDKRPERFCLRSGAAHSTRISCAAALTLSDAIKRGAHSTSGSSSRYLAPLHGSNTPNGIGQSRSPCLVQKKTNILLFSPSSALRSNGRSEGTGSCDLLVFLDDTCMQFSEYSRHLSVTAVSLCSQLFIVRTRLR